MGYMNRMLATIGSWWTAPVSPVSFLYPLAMMVAMFLASSIPGTVQPPDLSITGLFAWMPPSLQNTLHIPVYALLAMLIKRALGLWAFRVTTASLIAFTISAIYGVFDEWHQHMVPGRYASATDVLLNALGAALGVWLHNRLSKPTVGWPTSP